MNYEFLQDYCCINKYLLGPCIQVFTRKPILLNNIKIDVVNEVISFIKEKVQAINSSQISIELLHDHITLTVRSHTYYLLFDDVLNSNYYQDDSSDHKEFTGTKKQLAAVMIIEEDIEMNNSKKAFLI